MPALMPQRPAALRPTGASRAITVGTGLYLLGLVGVLALLHTLADIWWPATLVMFAPRWLWALPLLVLVPAAWARQRRMLWPLALAALIQLFGISGFVFPTLPLFQQARATPPLRVLTYNLGGGALDSSRIALWLEKLAPDVAVFQECMAPLEAAKPGLLKSGWFVEIQNYSCLVSRHRVRAVEVRDPKEIWKIGGSGVIVRYEVDAPGRMINLVNLHLETVREGLDALRQDGLAGASEMKANIDLRDLESSLAAAFAQRIAGPLIVAGDFNLPVESAIYRRHWSTFTNAFDCAGGGLGATKLTRWHGIRIDHVLLGKGWHCLAARVGEGLGLDHRPLVAELHWAGGP